MRQAPFMNLLIWKKGMELAKTVYGVTHLFPKQELYGLTSQMNRSAVSVPSNIAEGSQRTTDKEFAQFILHAKGSLAELCTQIVLSKELAYMTEGQFTILMEQIQEIDKMLWAFHRKLIATRLPLQAQI